MGERFPKGARVRRRATGQLGVVIPPAPMPGDNWRYVMLDDDRASTQLCHVDGLDDVGMIDDPVDLYDCSAGSGVGPVASEEPAPLPPWACAVASGAALWQQADPMRRECHVHIRGHVVAVTVGADAGRDAYTAKFLGPVREAAVGAALDLVVADESHTPHVFGLNRHFPEEIRP